MERRVPEPDPESELEDAGIPDLENSFPERLWAADPQRAPIPGDTSLAMDEFGTTAEEQRRREPLDDRLRREEPEPTAEEYPDAWPAGRIVEEDEGTRPDTEKDAVAFDVGPDTGGFSAEEMAMRVEDEENWE